GEGARLVLDPGAHSAALVEGCRARHAQQLRPAPVNDPRSWPADRLPPRQTVELTLPIGPGENAVVLLEQDGVYRWQLLLEGWDQSLCLRGGARGVCRDDRLVDACPSTGGAAW